MAGIFRASTLTVLAASLASVVATPPACLLACVALVGKDSKCSGLNDLDCMCGDNNSKISSCLDKTCPDGDADAAKKQLKSTCNGIESNEESSSEQQSSTKASSSETSAEASATEESSAEEKESSTVEKTTESQAEATESAEESAQETAQETESAEESVQETEEAQSTAETTQNEGGAAVPEGEDKTTQATVTTSSHSAIPTVSSADGAAKLGAGAVAILAGLALL